MKKLVYILLVVLFVSVMPIFAADTAPASSPAVSAPANPIANTVKGKMDIKFNSRTKANDEGVPEAGVKDEYSLDIQAANAAVFKGRIEFLPPIFSSTLKREIQASTLSYNIDLLLCNPKNPAQTKAVGKLTGGVPLTRKGVYEFDKSNLRIAVNASGKAAGFESAFRGSIAGKPPKGGESLLENAKKKAQTITKQYKGKTVRLVVTNYDSMNYSGLVLAAGPVKGDFPETTVNGETLYDYETYTWIFRGLTMTYLVDGKTVTDKITGNIRWIESPQRKTNGEGEYQFDVRFNEPEQKNDTAAAFQPADDAAAFFETDTSLPSLTGTAKYKDQMRGDTVASSEVNIDLIGNNLNKLQIINAVKLLWLVNVVPMNAE